MGKNQTASAAQDITVKLHPKEHIFRHTSSSWFFIVPFALLTFLALSAIILMAEDNGRAAARNQSKTLPLIILLATVIFLVTYALIQVYVKALSQSILAIIGDNLVMKGDGRGVRLFSERIEPIKRFDRVIFGQNLSSFSKSVLAVTNPVMAMAANHIKKTQIRMIKFSGRDIIINGIGTVFDEQSLSEFASELEKRGVSVEFLSAETIN